MNVFYIYIYSDFNGIKALRSHEVEYEKES